MTPPQVVACTLQMFAKTSPEVSSNLTNVKKWASAAGYPIDKILGLISEMVTDGKGRFRTSYLSDRTYVTAGVASISVSFELGHYILYIRRTLFHARVCDDHFCAFDYDFFPHCRRVINPKLLRLKKKKRISPYQLWKYKCHASKTVFLFNIQFYWFPAAMLVIYGLNPIGWF